MRCSPSSRLACPKDCGVLPAGRAVSDQPESFLAAELVREQLLAGAHEELPHSITVSVDEMEERTTKSGEPLLVLRCIVRVERESQKGIVIRQRWRAVEASGERRAPRAGVVARYARVHLETRVKVDPDWQQRPAALDRLGY